MTRLLLQLAGYPWDHITPLLTGDVVPEGIDLQYDVHHGLGPEHRLFLHWPPPRSASSGARQCHPRADTPRPRCSRAPSVGR